MERLAFSVIWEVTPDAEVRQGAAGYAAVVRSTRRELHTLLEHSDGVDADCMPHLHAASAHAQAAYACVHTIHARQKAEAADKWHEPASRHALAQQAAVTKVGAVNDPLIRRSIHAATCTPPASTFSSLGRPRGLCLMNCCCIFLCRKPSSRPHLTSDDSTCLSPIATGGVQPVHQVSDPQLVFRPALTNHTLFCIPAALQVVSSQFSKSIIRSRAALTYAEAQSRIDDERLTDELSVSSLRDAACLCFRLCAWPHRRAVGEPSGILQWADTHCLCLLVCVA